MSAAVSFESVSVRYGGRIALDGVSAAFRAGAITGVIGPNGAGKTTLLRAALSLQPVATGTVCVFLRPLSEWSRTSLARTIAYLPQGGEARWPLRARDLVMLGRLPHRVGSATATDRWAVDDALTRCDARGFANRRMDELSAGERARVMFARALATRAKVLLADEPAAFLDPAHQLQLMELLRQEARRGTAVAVTLHDLTLAARNCDEIAVLHRGRLAAGGAPDEALSNTTLGTVFGIAALRIGANGNTLVPISRL